MVKNVHTRRFAASLDEVRPWIEACWTGTARDCFPRDAIANWRRNPDGVDPLASIPGVTLVGHGPFRFRLREWDGRSWKVDVVSRRITGWHGFDLAPDGDGCTVTHTVELDGSLSTRLQWRAIEPLHDWAVEALLDRLEVALATGSVPAQTTRRKPVRVALGLRLAARSGRRRSSSRSRQDGADLAEST